MKNISKSALHKIGRAWEGLGPIRSYLWIGAHIFWMGVWAGSGAPAWAIIVATLLGPITWRTLYRLWSAKDSLFGAYYYAESEFKRIKERRKKNDENG